MSKHHDTPSSVTKPSPFSSTPSPSQSHSQPESPSVRHTVDDNADSGAPRSTDPSIVMAESIAHDVVKEAQSVGSHHQPSDDLANTTNEFSAGHGQATTTTTTTQTTTSSSLSPPYDAHDSHDEDVLAAVNGVASAERSVLDGEAGSAGDLLLSKGEDVTSSLAESVAQALADASGGSDTDTSRADPSKDDAKGHARTSSLKKPASFKPVSVTKSFLAKSLSASPVPRVGDKGIPTSPSPTSALLSAKPRLVAKSALGGNTRGITKMNGTAGPDASKVWNKNRPVPAPAPRQFTDEELQTRYGIHMTARLQSDEAGKDSKWADIDDDEDDWAPETVEWMDGTKSNVGAEPQPLPVRQEDRAPTPSTRDHSAEPPKQPVLTSMHQPTVSQTTKTILRPGAQLSSSPKPGSAQKAGSDKSAPGTTKPAAPPSKSPWAVLPPVEKIAPIIPPSQQAQRPFQRDPQGFDALPPAPSPAQEIAADDFSRSYRDDRAPRELFNAQSGRYEPASDARRGSRHEHGYRQPAVLQRPSQGGMSNGPAEPSAAFQTSRSSLEGGGQWSRRRASSSLSAAGGRRPSLALSQDHSQHHSEVAVESPKAAFANLDRTGPWTRSTHPPPMESPVAEGEGQSGEVQQPVEDPIIKQQRMMKEKIEQARLAKQKRMEAEAAEVAARQERLKLKMAQLAPASPSPEVHEQVTKGVSPQTSAVQPPKTNAVSPPKPPIPTAEGEVAQYGMMKVHQPHPVKKNFVSEASLTAKANQDSGAEYNQRFRGATSPNKVVARPTGAQHQLPAAGEKSQQQKGLPNVPAAGSAAAPLDKVAGSWTASPPANEYNWGPNTMNARSAVGASVWGPPSLSNEKSLGNGTFESKFSHPNYANNRFDNSRGGGLPAQGPMHGPIGSGIKGTATPPQRQSQFASTFQNLTTNTAENSTVIPQQEQQPPSQSPSVDDQAFVSAHLDSSLQQSIAQTSSLHPQTTSQPSYTTANGNNMSAQVALPPTTAAPMGISDSRKLGSQDRARDWQLGGGRATQKGWQNFQADEKRVRDVEINKYQRDLASSKPQPKKTSNLVMYDVYREGPTNTVEIFHVTIKDGQKTTLRGATFPLTPNNAAKIKESEAEHPEDHPAKSEQLTNGLPQATTSSSRFFPKTAAAAAAAAAAAPQPSAIPQTSVTEGEAPPPAEQDLFEHDTSQPVKVKFPIQVKVNLPGMKASPVLLPPRSPGLDKTFSAPAVAPPSAPHGPRALPHTMRVDDLKAKFGHSHLGSGVFANTKPTFDVTVANAHPNGLTQSQHPRVTPAAGPKTPLFATHYSSSTTSRPLAEDDCFDFPDFGSKPTVRVPTVPHQNHQFGYQDEGAMAAPLPRYMKHYQVLDTQSVSRDEAQLFPTEKGDKFGSKVTIKLTGMKNPKYVDARIPRRGGGGGVRPDAPYGSRGGRGGAGGSTRSFEGGSRRGGFGSSSRGGGKNDTAGSGRGPKKTDVSATGTSNSSSSSPKPRGGGGQWTPRSGQSSGRPSATAIGANN